MAIKFSQFNLRTDHTSGMYLVGYDGNQNIHITVDNLFDDFINGTENTIAMFGTDGTVLADSIVSQNAGATGLTVTGTMTVTSDATFSANIEVEGTADFNGNVNLGDESSDLITQTGTLYLNGPVKDTTDTLGAVDQVLLSDATGELTFTDLADLHVGGAEVVEVPVKNMQGSALVKGDPVYISGSVGASGRLEVQLADASNTLKMPAVGLLKQDLAINEEGFAVVTGKLRNLITDPIDGVTPTENDVIYVKPSGTSGAALTTTKPVYGNFIQNIGKVGRVSTSNDGNFVVSSILRTNDIPNLTPGRLWVGSTGNTIESQTLFVDEASSEVGIGTTDPYAELHIKNTVDNPGLMIESEEATGGIYQNSYINLRARESSTNTLANGNISIHGVNSTNSAGAKTLVIKNQTLGGADVLISTLDSSSSAKNPARFKSSGQIQFEEYGSGSFTGTIAKNLSIDSSGNIIETDPAVDGSGTLNYVTKWTPDGNTLGDSIIFDNGTQVGIGTESVSTFKLTVAGGVKIDGSNLNITNIIPAIYLNSSNSNPDWSLNNQGGEFSIRNNTLSQKRLTISSTGQVGFTLYGQNTFTGTAAKNLSVTSSGAIIETDAVPANIVETITTTDGTYINLTPNTATDGDVTVTADLSAVDGTSGTNERYLTKNNTWAEVAAIPGTYNWDISDGVNLPDTIASGETVTFAGGTDLTTAYAASTNTLTIDHDAISRANSNSTSNPGYGNTFVAIDNIVTNATGHVTGVNTVTVTMPSAENYSWSVEGDLGTPYTVNSGNTVDIAGSTYITTSTLSGPTLAITHDNTARNDTASSASPGYGGTFTVVDSVSTNATGHLEAINVKTVTMPSADDTNTTYDLSGYGTTNGTAGVKLVGSDSTTDQVAVTGAGTTTVTHSGNTLTITSNDQYTGTMSSWIIKEGNGSETATVTNGETVTIAQGTGIQSEMTSTSSGGTITITNTDRGSSQNIFKNFAVSGQSTVVADSNNDTLTLVAGSNVSITTNATNDSITINATDTNTNNYVTSASFNTGDGVLTLSRTGLSAVTVDLDGRYLTSYTETDTLATVVARGNSTSNSIYAPSFIDYNNNSYYVDPAGDSQLNTIDIDDYIRHRGDVNTYIGFPSNDNFVVATANTVRLQINSDGSIEQGNSSAAGQYAAAFGQNNTASSLDAFATGENTIAQGRQSFSGGFNTTASGAGSFAIGGNSVAQGTNSFCAGGDGTTTGATATSIGTLNDATNDYSFAAGYNSTASGLVSFAIGSGTVASGPKATAFGEGNGAGGELDFAIGAYNTSTPNLAYGNFMSGYDNNIHSSAGPPSSLNILGGTLNEIGSTSIANTSGDLNIISGSNNKIGFAYIGSTATAASAADRNIVQGNFNTVLAGDSICVGRYNRTSNGSASATIGFSLVTPTNGATSGNAYATAEYDTQFIVGRWNNFNVNNYTQGHRFAVGNGTSDSLRFTAFNVLATSGNARVGIAQDIPSYPLDVTGTGRFTGGTTTSDERLKENIQDNTLGLSELVQLRTVTFDWKTDENLLGRTMEDIPQNKNCKGLIAQEAEAVSSDLVETDDSEHEIKSINQGALTTMLIKAIQEQQDVIESLTERIQALENN